MANAYIIDAVRTPRGRGKPGKGALSGIHPQELVAQTLNRLVEKTGIDPVARARPAWWNQLRDRSVNVRLTRHPST